MRRCIRRVVDDRIATSRLRRRSSSLIFRWLLVHGKAFSEDAVAGQAMIRPSQDFELAHETFLSGVETFLSATRPADICVTETDKNVSILAVRGWNCRFLERWFGAPCSYPHAIDSSRYMTFGPTHGERAFDEDDGASALIQGSLPFFSFCSFRPRRQRRKPPAPTISRLSGR
jgi:hypothetical protein